jgi:hypothetical protein
VKGKDSGKGMFHPGFAPTECRTLSGQQPKSSEIKKVFVLTKN